MTPPGPGPLLPTFDDRLARARADLRIGLPVVLTGPDGATAMAAVETLGTERLQALAGLSNEAVVAVTRRRAETLKARAYSDHVARIRLRRPVDPAWVRDLADPARDLASPMKGPFETLRGGDEIAARAALALAKSARLLPAAVLVPVAPGFAAAQEATALDAAETLARVALLSPHREAVAAGLPIAAHPRSRLHVFRPDNGGEEHYALEIGRPSREAPVLTRLHSACFTGDVLGSLKCDCGPQLHGALEAMAAEGAGVLLYLNQEGRGIGLANKMRAYELQAQGFDTVEANHRLGFEDDERDFRIGAELLGRLGFRKVRLMTNNPAKVARLEGCGLEVVERVPLKVGRGALNDAYLDTKAAKSGHLL